MTELATSRLVLRPPRPDDAPCFALGMGEFAVARWLSPVPWPFTLSMASAWLRDAPAPTPERALFIIEHPQRGLIGCVMLANELGFWLARPHWGKGYATEAASALISWHFAGTDRPLIASSAHRDNTASLRLKARLGFTEVGRERRYSQPLQCNVEHVLTQLTRATWQARESLRCA